MPANFKTVSTTRHQVNQVLIPFINKEAFMRVRKDKPNCWKCHKPFASFEDIDVALAFTSRGNKPICLACAEILVAAGAERVDHKRE